MAIGAIATSAFASGAFLAAFLIAYLSKDQANMPLLYGAVISNFSTTVSFWLGSSAGSQKKDDALVQKATS